jgi:hypothetical protein
LPPSALPASAPKRRVGSSVAPTTGTCCVAVRDLSKSSKNAAVIIPTEGRKVGWPRALEDCVPPSATEGVLLPGGTHAQAHTMTEVVRKARGLRGTTRV